MNNPITNSFPYTLSEMPAQAALHLQRLAMEASVNGIVIADMRLPDRPLIYVNPAFETITGYPAEEILGKNCRFLQGADQDSDSNRAARQTMRDALDRGVPCNIILHNFRKDGTPFWNELYMAPIFDAEGVLTHCVGIQNDVTARKKAQDQLAHLAFHDALTGLPNRALLLNRLEQVLARAGRTGNAVGLLFVDLDNFKGINDSLGHEAGDTLLQTIAQRLRGCTRPGDTAARLGGDEFVILLEELGGAGEAEAVAKRVTEAIHQSLCLGGHDVFPGASIGLTITALGDVRTAGDLLRDADTAMYQAKQQGKGRSVLFSPSINTRIQAGLELEADGRQAIAKSDPCGTTQHG